MTRYDLNARRSELIALIKAKTGLRAFKARTVRDPGNGGFQLKDAGTPGFFGMLVMGRGRDNHADFMAARRVLLDAGVRETYLNEPGCAMVFWPWPGAAPHAKPRTNPEAALPAWLTALDGARYFTREALATAVAESGWRSRTALVAMAPETFLTLAVSGYTPQKAANVDAALQTTGAFWDVPYLMIEEDGDSAQVTGHEGRHRARALQALGVREMPVRIHARWLRWQETPEDAPRWLIPEKGGYGRTPVAMPPILGAAPLRQNGGPRKSTPRAVVVDPDMLVVLTALVRWVQASAAAELRNWGKHVNPQDVKVTSAHAVVYTTLKDGAARRAFYRLVKAKLLLPVQTREVTHSVRHGQGGASNFHPRQETRESTITDYRIADAGFAIVDGR